VRRRLFSPEADQRVKYTRHVSAGMIVFHRAEGGCRFLLVLSRLTKRPLWEFPKGGVDEGETLIETATRELEEETGLTAQNISIVPGFQRTEDYRFSSGQGQERTLIHKRVTYFLAESDTMEVTVAQKEISQHAWLELADAVRKLKYKERRQLLQEAAAFAGCAAATSS